MTAAQESLVTELAAERARHTETLRQLALARREIDRLEAHQAEAERLRTTPPVRWVS